MNIFVFVFIGFMLKVKKFIRIYNLFSSNDYENNDKIILKWLKLDSNPEPLSS